MRNSILTLLGLVGVGFCVARAQEVAPSDAPYVPLPKNSVTFNKQIAPILYANCTTCHHEGEVAPFALSSYEDARKRAKQIAMVTESRFMPPWKSDEGREKFHDARRLSNQEIGLLAQWARDGAPRGTEPEPVAPTFAKGWRLGEPDAVFKADAAYTLSAEGDDVYRCFVLPTNYDSDRYISAFQVRAGNAKIVHHVIAYLDTQGRGREHDAKDDGPGYTAFGGIGFAPSGWVGGWAPGIAPQPLPDGVGILLPKGADIILQVHYHPSGKSESDLTQLGIYFCKTPVDKRMRVAPVINPALKIPAGEANHLERAGFTSTEDMTVLQVTPHMHWLGRSMLVTATPPNAPTQKLVNVPDWDFNWQTVYAFQKPLRLPAGTQVKVEARYDNSPKNPLNPNTPPKDVKWGEQTTDEMCLAFLGYTLDSEHLRKDASTVGEADGFIGNRGEMLEQLRTSFDRDNDGTLSRDEGRAMLAFIQDWTRKRQQP